MKFWQNHVKNEFEFTAKTQAPNKQFSHVLTQESSCHGLVQENKWQNPFLKVTKWFEARLYQQTLDLGVLPATSFMLSFFVYRITEATISHSPPILKKKKIYPPEKPSDAVLFPRTASAVFTFALLVLCRSRSTLQITSWHF